MKSWSRSEAPFLSTLFLVFIAAASLLLINLTEKTESSKEFLIGTIAARQRRAERKFNDQVIWDFLYQDAPIFNRDTIRTAADSAATVYLDDGTRIDMDEETMILVDISEEKSVIDVSGGTVVVSRSAAPAARLAKPAASSAGTADVFDLTPSAVSSGAFAADKITIRTSRASVILEEGAVALRDDGERISVAVNEGSAELDTAAGGSIIQKAQAATVGSEGVSAAAIPLIPVKPAQGAELFTVSETVSVDFEWIGQTDFSGNLILSADPDFKVIVASGRVAGKKAALALAAGSYYWRLEGMDKTTETRRVAVIRLVEPALIDPLPTLIAYRGGKLPLVDLAWLPAYPKTGYLVEVSASRDFSSAAISVRTNYANISVSPSAEGEWFWRAKALYPDTGMETSTAVASFIVARKAAETPIIRGDAAEPIQTSELSLLGSGVALSWSQVEGADAYIVSVAVDEAIKNIVLQRRTTASSITLDGELAPGLYYVAVSVEEADEVSPPSAPRALIVTDPEPIVLLSPALGAVLPAGAVSFSISWRDPNGLGRYAAELSGQEDFSATLAKAEVVGTRGSLTLPKNAVGTLYWRVARINDDGAAVLISPVSSVWKPRLMEKANPIGPRNGETIDVFYTEEIVFSWEPVDGASHYSIVLHRMLSENPVQLRKWTVPATSFTLRDFSMLAEGYFAWDVTAFDEHDGLVRGSSDAARAYYRIIQSREVDAPVIALPKVIFVK